MSANIDRYKYDKGICPYLYVCNRYSFSPSRDREVTFLEIQILSIIIGVTLNKVLKQPTEIKILVIGNLNFDFGRNIVTQVIVIARP